VRFCILNDGLACPDRWSLLFSLEQKQGRAIERYC
jgi:hypothetical protein